MTKEAPSGVASITVNDEGESNRVVTLFKMWYICQVCYMYTENQSPHIPGTGYIQVAEKRKQYGDGKWGQEFVQEAAWAETTCNSRFTNTFLHLAYHELLGEFTALRVSKSKP